VLSKCVWWAAAVVTGTEYRQAAWVSDQVSRHSGRWAWWSWGSWRRSLWGVETFVRQHTSTTMWAVVDSPEICSRPVTIDDDCRPSSPTGRYTKAAVYNDRTALNFMSPWVLRDTTDSFIAIIQRWTTNATGRRFCYRVIMRHVQKCFKFFCRLQIVIVVVIEIYTFFCVRCNNLSWFHVFLSTKQQMRVRHYTAS